MKHSRKDYAHIQDTTGKIPHDEPVFLLRGQDKLAVNALRTYIGAAISHGVDADTIENVRSALNDIITWQAERREKLPDMPREAKAERPLNEFSPKELRAAFMELVKVMQPEELHNLRTIISAAIDGEFSEEQP